MTGWGTGTECDDGCSGTVAAQQYMGTTITLADASHDGWEYDCFGAGRDLFGVE